MNDMTSPYVRLWELAVASVGLFLCAMVGYQRELIYSKGRWGLLDSHNLSVLGILLFAIVLLIASRPWRSVSRHGAKLRMLSLALTVGTFLTVTLWGTGWGRYQTLRVEALYHNFGITSFEKGLRRNFNSETCQKMVGPYLAKDKRLLQLLARESGSEFLQDPRAARAVLASLARHGVSVDSIAGAGQGSKFLLACLVSETDQQPWHGLDWIVAPKAQGSPFPDFHTELLTKQDARRILAPFLPTLEQQDRGVLEALTFSVMNFPELFSTADQDRIVDAWAKSFDQLENLAVEGLVVRDQIKEFLQAARQATVFLEVSGAPPSDYSYQWLPQTLPQMVEGVIRSCGVKLSRTDKPEQADLRLTIHLSEMALYQYSRPDYSYEDYFEYRNSGFSRKAGWTGYTTKVRKTRQVLTGHSDQTAFAPAATVSLLYQGRTLELGPGLIMWQSLTYDTKKKQYPKFESEDSWGRMWPLGIRQRLVEYHFMTDPKNTRDS